MTARKRRSEASSQRMEQIIAAADRGLEQVQRQEPLVNRLHAYMAARVKVNGFGRDFTMSMQPKGAADGRAS